MQPGWWHRWLTRHWPIGRKSVLVPDGWTIDAAYGRLAPFTDARSTSVGV